MKCPHCGADSSVDATRKFNGVMLKRSRRCFNGHSFTTYEVFAGNIDRRTLESTARGVAAKGRSFSTKRRILARPDASAADLAAELSVSNTYVRLVRARARTESAPQKPPAKNFFF